MKKNIYGIVLALGVSLCLLAGCSTSDNNTETADSSDEVTEMTETVQDATVETEESETQEAKKEETMDEEKADEKTIEWSYSGNTGPEYWGSLDSKFSIADTGTCQSPINIEIANTVTSEEDLSIQYNYHSTLFEVENNGHTIEAIPESTDNTITINGKTFTLAQFHLHSLSEHQIEGEHYAMEIHLVHKNENGEIAVIGLLVQAGNENELLKEMFDNMPATVTTEDEMVSLKEEIDLNSLIPTDSKVFRYEGSLTTPPTTEGVVWSVYETPIELSEEQISKFQEIYSNNYRPVQALNGREVVSY